MKNNLSPSYLTDLIPEHTNHQYALRNTENIPLVHAKTQSYANSFIPLTIREWNNLSLETRNSATLSVFKNKLKNPTSCLKHIYYLGKRKEQINHTRLRLGCSLLNYDLQRRNLIFSSRCTCGEIETATHYLLKCQKYQTLRNRFFASLPCPITLNNLLFGNTHLSFQANKTIFLQVQEFIAASKRFG